MAKTCPSCRASLPHSAFAADRSTRDGLTGWCRSCRNRASRSRYQPHARVRGKRLVAARDGDVKQARRRVNYLVEIRTIPPPNEVRCARCGHLGTDRRHEYHHHLGYAAVHHEAVVALCSSCHHADHASAGAVANG